jgi:hypothetical protein
MQYRQLKSVGLKSKQKIIKGIQQTFLIGSWHEGPQTLLLDIVVCLYVFKSFAVHTCSLIFFPKSSTIS